MIHENSPGHARLSHWISMPLVLCCTCRRSYDGEEDVAKAFKARMAQLSQQHKQTSKPRSLLGSIGKH
jgi:hypothetical protein